VTYQPLPCATCAKPLGVLCFGCNAGLGHFDDNPSLLELAMRYLEASR